MSSASAPPASVLHFRRQWLNQLFAVDSVLSMVLGLSALVSPHRLVQASDYSHAAHEALRLYGCLRLACGWMVFHIRQVDHGPLRRRVCEALGVCYALQFLAVLRATPSSSTALESLLNSVGLLTLGALALAYGTIRIRYGDKLTKSYDLPTSGSLA